MGSIDAEPGMSGKVRGDRPQPSTLKVLADNPKKDKLNVFEPIPDELLDAKPPKQLSKMGKKIWAEIVQSCPTGLLRSTDAHDLFMHCSAFATYLDAYEKVQEQGSVILVPPSGRPVVNPYMEVMSKQVNVILSTSNSLGLNPSARSRISMRMGNKEPTPSPEDFKQFKKKILGQDVKPKKEESKSSDADDDLMMLIDQVNEIKGASK